jgi:hypothetical protein
LRLLLKINGHPNENTFVQGHQVFFSSICHEWDPTKGIHAMRTKKQSRADAVKGSGHWS